MDNSDDYFMDDIVLDEQAIATLDETESQFVAATHPRPPTALPPPKRQRTDNGWTAPPKRAQPSGFSLDDMPDITIRGGFYGVPGNSQPTASQKSAPSPSPNISAAGPSTIASGSRQGPPVSAPRPPQSRTNGPQPRFRHASVTPAPSQGLRRHQSTSNIAGRLAPANRQIVHSNLLALVSAEVDAIRNESQSHPAPMPAPATAAKPPVSRAASTHQPRPQPVQNAHYRSTLTPHPSRNFARTASNSNLADRSNLPQAVDTSRLQDEVAALREQLEALQRDNQQTQVSLEQALQEKRAKAGEAAILRQNLDKAADAHRQEQARLRAAKEKLEVAQAEAQRRQAEELERLRTQLIFKQHEMETSVRRPPMSVRASVKKEYAFSQATQSQMRRWDQPEAGPSKLSPMRLDRVQPPRSPPTSRKKLVPPPPPAKKTPGLPGFVNAFTSNSPERSQRVKGEGKEKARHSMFETSQWELDNLDLPPPSPPSSPTRPRIRRQAAPVAPTVNLDPDISIDMDVDPGPIVERVAPLVIEVFDDVEPPDWINRLQQIVFTHTLRPSTVNTFQQLLGSSIPHPDDAASYSLACGRILDALSIASPSNDFETIARTVCSALTHMAQLLQSHSLITPLPALLNLLNMLTVSLPFFAICLLTPTHDPLSKHTPNILTALGNIIVAHLQPVNESATLARELFHLLDILYWSIPPELESQLTALPRQANVLSTVLDPAQPTWFLRDAMRSLSLLASRPGNFRSLLSFSEDTPEDGNRDFRKLPHIQKMCALLINSERKGPEVNSMKEYLVTTFVQIAMAHADGVMILSESEFLVPTLVMFLTHHSTALWEEDETLMSSSSLISETISAIAHALLLLHYLVFHSEPPLNLRHKLQHAPHRPFNGIGHMFVVTFGRLSYADAPEQISKEDKVKLEQLAEPARDVMELVVEGPESESIWAVFQGSDEAEGGLDDDAVEVVMSDVG